MFCSGFSMPLSLLRSAPQDELLGLDVPEMGMPGYSNEDMVFHGNRFRSPLLIGTPALLPLRAPAKTAWLERRSSQWTTRLLIILERRVDLLCLLNKE